MLVLQNLIINLLWVLSSLIFFCSITIAQNKVDLELTVQSSSDTARGGETFSYTVTVRNRGSAKATDVVIMNRTDWGKVSAIPSVGACQESESPVPQPFQCLLGDIDREKTVVINFEIKIRDFGGESDDKSSKALKKMAETLSRIGVKPNPKGTLIADLDVSASESEENNENNRFEVFAVNLLPSKNLPPRVQIISPKDNAIIIRPAKKLTKVVFTIKAFDPDGTIEKVGIETHKFSISGVSPIIEEAKKIAKDTYAYVLENPVYGFNTIFVHVTDDGGRSNLTSVRIMVKGDNSIKFTKPLNESLIKPDTDVKIEAISKLNENSNGELKLIGNVLCCGNNPLMEQISRNGNRYVHQYVWKNIKKGYYYLQILLTEDTGAITYSDAIQFKVTEKPRVKITSLKSGQVFKEGQDIPVELEAVDPDGEIKNVSIFVNKKYYQEFSWIPGKYQKSGRIFDLRKGVYQINTNVTDDMDVSVESETITIIVK